MSRNWTPRECLIAEKTLNGKTWFDASRAMLLVINGTEHPMFPIKYFSFMEQFNYLKRVGLDAVYPLFKEHGDKYQEVLEKIEDCLAVYIEKGERIESWVCDWFDGVLDPGFYYTEHNNERFREEAEELRNKLQIERESQPSL